MKINRTPPLIALLIVLFSPSWAHASYGSELNALFFLYFIVAPIAVIGLIVAAIYFLVKDRSKDSEGRQQDDGNKPE